ncbi:superoxide dismutase family protein [Candidatus Laterigemmans baculatus]|uniref:superoxide dismutase family protein n=1 Tax=Candidatus Laterigemmans baculatus TaxID=2770505 RepID=UPI0013DC7488|nr:superoxide dismutase family protein [Candidatus Laterigemmans baculatus]
MICTLLIGTALALGSSFALADEHAHGEAGTHAHMEMPKLGIAILVPTEGNKTRGMLRLSQMGKDLKITGKIRNLTPGEHGFHIHEFGDLRSKDGTAAGGHFNPTGHEHGAPGEKSHVGDLGNITANEQGVATVNIVSKDTPLGLILGRAFVVHAGKDDLKSQPSGDAGPRVATGVIGVGNPEFSAQPKN